MAVISNKVQSPIFSVGKIGEKPTTFNPNQGILKPSGTLNSPGIGSAGQTIRPVTPIAKPGIGSAGQSLPIPTGNSSLVGGMSIKPSTGILNSNMAQTAPAPITAGTMTYDPSKGQLVPTGTQQQPQNIQPVQPVPPPQMAPTAPTTYPGMVQGLANLGTQDSPDVLAERQRLQDIRNSYANRTAGLERSGAGMSIIGGEEGIMARQQAAQEGVASQNLASAIATQGQRGGFLGTAAGLAAPQQVSPTNIPFNPLTGQFGQLAGSASTGGGGLAGVGALTEQANQGANVQTMDSAVQQSGALINKVKQDIQTSGFNPAPSAIGNALSAWINTGLFPNPAFANVINGLNEIVTTIAPVLGVPGNPTDAKLFMAQQLVPQLMSGQDLGSVLDNLEANARVKIGAARTASQSNAVTSPQTNGKSIYDF